MRDLVAGMRYLGKGQRWVAQHGRWWGFGLIPALIALVLYAAVLTVLAIWSGDIAAWATPFADGWDSPWQGLLRGVFVALLFAGGLMLSVLTFTAVTLLIGDPFYESLSEKVEESEGTARRPRAGRCGRRSGSRCGTACMCCCAPPVSAFCCSSSGSSRSSGRP